MHVSAVSASSGGALASLTSYALGGSALPSSSLSQSPGLGRHRNVVNVEISADDAHSSQSATAVGSESEGEVRESDSDLLYLRICPLMR